ncbi:MAG TPA: aspartate kinase [Anaerolineales bacterium]|jgi:aspartate kinase
MVKRSSKTLVMKFGGTSVGSSAAMAQATRIVKDARLEWARVVVVTSAISGATNVLLDCATRAAQGDLQPLLNTEHELLARHEKISADLVSNSVLRASLNHELRGLVGTFGDLCRAIAVLGEATPRALDAVASHGERMSARLLAAACESQGLPAQFVESTGLIITNSSFQSAHPDFAATAQATHARLLPMLQEGIVPVVTGFIGATPEGVITTLGRGGSDYSAAILGAVLPADDVWIWTDVDGVMTADPRLVPDARTLPEISYAEIAELAYFGAKVLHPKAVRPVVEAGIGLRICNTFNPSHPGTRLVANHGNGHAPNGEKVIKAVTTIRNQRLVTIEGRGMLGVPGVAARTFAAVASTGTSVPLITQASSEQSICFAIPGESTGVVLAALSKVFATELADRDIDRIWATEDVSIITVVGTGTRNTPGVAGQIFSKLGDINVNMLAIAHGSSDVSISMAVDSIQDRPSVQALHELIVS